MDRTNYIPLVTNFVDQAQDWCDVTKNEIKKSVKSLGESLDLHGILVIKPLNECNRKLTISNNNVIALNYDFYSRLNGPTQEFALARELAKIKLKNYVQKNEESRKNLPLVALIAKLSLSLITVSFSWYCLLGSIGLCILLPKVSPIGFLSSPITLLSWSRGTGIISLVFFSVLFGAHLKDQHQVPDVNNLAISVCSDETQKQLKYVPSLDDDPIEHYWEMNGRKERIGFHLIKQLFLELRV